VEEYEGEMMLRTMVKEEYKMRKREELESGGAGLIINKVQRKMMRLKMTKIIESNITKIKINDHEERERWI
jgi:hypothetical protein